MQCIDIRLPHARDGGTDVGVGFANNKGMTVIDRAIPIENGDKVDEETGDTAVQFEKGMQGDEFALIVGKALGETRRWPMLRFLQEILGFELTKYPPGFLFQKGRATEQRTTLCHINRAIQPRPIVKRRKGALVQRTVIGLVEAGFRRDLDNEGLIGLLEQGLLYRPEHVSIFKAQAVAGNFRAWEVDVTFLELILGHATFPSGL